MAIEKSSEVATKSFISVRLGFQFAHCADEGKAPRFMSFLTRTKIMRHVNQQIHAEMVPPTAVNAGSRPGGTCQDLVKVTWLLRHCELNEIPMRLEA